MAGVRWRFCSRWDLFRRRRIKLFRPGMRGWRMRDERFAICDLRFASGCCADGEGGGKGRAGEEAKGRGRGGFVSSKKCGGTGGKSLIWEWWRGFGRFSV